MSVSQDAIRSMASMQGQAKSDPSFQPVVQVINIKPVKAQVPGGKDRYRVSQMLPTRTNELFSLHALILLHLFTSSHTVGRPL